MRTIKTDYTPYERVLTTQECQARKKRYAEFFRNIRARIGVKEPEHQLSIHERALVDHDIAAEVARGDWE